jgi:hypothetical protein
MAYYIGHRVPHHVNQYPHRLSPPSLEINIQINLAMSPNLSLANGILVSAIHPSETSRVIENKHESASGAYTIRSYKATSLAHDQNVTFFDKSTTLYMYYIFSRPSSAIWRLGEGR